MTRDSNNTRCPLRLTPARRGSMGYSMIELLMGLAIIALIAAMGFPMMGNMLGYFRLNGDARALANSVSLARMRAASNFSRARLYIDLTTGGYRTETKTVNGIWTTQGNVTYLSTTNDTYGFAPVATAPPSTQSTLAQASQCMDNQTPPQAIANTACIVFNSRGIPIDSTGAPTGAGAIYITDGTIVYGVTVSATSVIRTWRTMATATPTWIRQ